MKNIIIYFLTGGIVTALIVLLEQGGFRLLSGIAALVPVFTFVAYIFIGSTEGAIAVSQHAKFVLWGTIVSWIPYMIAVAYLSPRIGVGRALAVGLSLFFVLAILFIMITTRYHLFQ